MGKARTALITSVVLAGLLAGCGGQKGGGHSDEHKGHNPGGGYKDGTYTARSGTDELGGVGVITLTIENGRITKADFKGIQVTGQPKDAEYGKTIGNINQEYYNKAQKAVKGAAAYAPRLIETQDVDKVDAVSGATVSHSQFTEAVKKALKQAQGG
jgi:major membrane immunogen (membrane-anchored lipoprotein)